jgi:hypothetical protein
MENNCPTTRQLDDILENPEEEKKYTSSVIEETLKRAETDENYKINNKDYLEELGKLNEILKEYPQLLLPVETLVKKINELDSKENEKYWYRFKDVVIRSIIAYLKYFKVFERRELNQQAYQEKINDVCEAISYLSSVLYPLYEKYFLKEIWNNFMEPYLTLENSIKKVSNELEERIINLLNGPKWYKKHFEELIYNQRT